MFSQNSCWSGEVREARTWLFFARLLRGETGDRKPRSRREKPVWHGATVSRGGLRIATEKALLSPARFC